MLLKIHNSYLYYIDKCDLINDYYQNIIDLIKKILYNNKQIEINIIFGSTNVDFNNNNKIIRINLNWEHTLVKQGGRSSANSQIGVIKDINNNNYLVRIDRYSELMGSDIIIDYSIPNICNVGMSNLFEEFSKKHIYIYSSIYESYFIKENRNITTLTTFINTNEPRRRALLENIKEKNIPHNNVNNCFVKNDLKNLYKNTKIIINIHQTNHHDTFEELRVLPALQCGVIVVCENSPLSELIAYNDYIIWSTYDKILDKVNEVIENYDYYHNLIFVNKKKISLDFESLNAINYDILQNKIINNYTKHPKGLCQENKNDT